VDPVGLVSVGDVKEKTGWIQDVVSKNNVIENPIDLIQTNISNQNPHQKDPSKNQSMTFIHSIQNPRTNLNFQTMNQLVTTYIIEIQRIQQLSLIENIHERLLMLEQVMKQDLECLEQEGSGFGGLDVMENNVVLNGSTKENHNQL
jgi:hypothetical protein